MNKFLERLNSGEILVADGATGSNLQKMGLKPGKPPEDLTALYNLTACSIP